MTAADDLVSGRIDRAEHERSAPDLIERLRSDPATGVLVVRGDRVPTRDDRLVLARPGDVDDPDEWAFLGRDDGGRGILAAVHGAPAADGERAAWGALRELGGALPADDATLLVGAVALGRWLVDAPYCPGCGTRSEIRASGWARSCPSCGRDEFPRADPAVIATITGSHDPDSLLLGSHTAWGQRRYSCFAGFVEAGESLEDTVVRELREEAGVDVADLRYLGSQAWPYPRSLMVGFHTRAVDGAVARADGEEIADVRWFGREQVRAALAGDGDVLLPGPGTIARRLIVDWLEARP